MTPNDSPEVADLRHERDILAQAQELANVGAWEWQLDAHTLWLSDQAFRIFGHDDRVELVTRDWFLGHIHPDDREELWRSVEATSARDGRFDYSHRVLRPDGSIRHVRARGRVTEFDGDRPVTMLGTVMDITDETLLQQERDRAVVALAASEQRHRLLAENAWDVIWTMGLDGSITYVSPSVQRMRGITPEEAMAQAPQEIHPPESLARVGDYYSRLFQAIAAGTELPTFHGEQEYYRKDGSIMYGELDVVPQVDADGNVVQILGVTRDISERKRLERELNRLAHTDPLTGVWNRRHMEALLAQAIADARATGVTLSALMLDIDRFKQTNDRHGHRAGDEVIVELVRRVSQVLPRSAVLCRWGGEEFVVLCDRCSQAGAVELPEQLRQVVAAEPFEELGAVTVSIGVAQQREGDDVAAWIHRADEAMYRAKQAGRNTVVADGGPA